MHTLDDIAHYRLTNQRLVGTPHATPEAVVRSLGAVQSQDYGGAKWAVAQRTAGATNADLDQLFDSGAILRTHILRPTWHFVLPEDTRWMQMLTAPRVRAAMAHYDRKLELDDAVYGHSHRLLADALRGGNFLTRPELAQVLEHGGITASGQRLGHLMMRAELDAVIVSGPRRGTQFTYALLDERAPATPPRDRDEALAALTVRYFTSHGPATAADFAWWSGISVTDAKAGIASVAPQFEQETIDGKAYWFAAPQTMPALPSPVVHLLPNYDEHLVAYRDHRATLDPAMLGHLDPIHASLLGYLILRDGRVIGDWRRTVGRDAVNVETNLLVTLDAAETVALQAAVEAYGRFTRMPIARA